MTPIGITLNLSGERQVEQGLQRVRGAMDNVGAAAGGLVRVMGGLGGAFAGVLSVREFIQAADAVTSLQNQLKLATGSASQAAQAYDALFDIAQRSRVSFTELGGTFASIARATGELGISQQRLLTVTEAIGNAVTISGTGAQAANAALVQLGQGLASGTLRGEELNSVMEQTPRLAQALADGLGITTGELRKLGSEGAITAEKVIKALESQAGALRNEVKDAVLTVGQAMTQLQSQTVRFVGDVDKATSASGTLAQSITGVASALGELQQTEVFMDSLRTVGETVTVLFNDVAFVLKGIGREIGGIAAQAAAVARLDFQGAAAIRNEMVADAVSARATLDARQLAILTRGSGRATAEDGAAAAARGVGRRSSFDAELSRYLGEDVRQTRDEIRAEEVAKARQRNAELVAKAEGDVNAQLKLQAALKVELANIEDKYRDKGSAAGVKAEQSAYESLMTTINEKIGTVQAELLQNDKLTASQKIAIDMEAGLLSGKLKLSSARKAELEGRLEDLRTLEEEIAARQRLVQSFDAMEAAQAKALADRDALRGQVYDAEQEAKQIGLVGAALGELTQARMEDAAAALERQAITRQIMGDDTTAQALREQAQAMRDLYRVQGNNEAARGVAAYAGAIRESSEALDYELSLMGMAERARATALEQYRIEIELRKQIQQIEANTAADPERRSQLIAEATAAAAIAKANASSKVFLEEWKQSVQQYDDIFRQGFADMLNNGEDGWKSFTRSLVTTFKTTVADQIYKMFAQPFVVNIVGNLLGVTGGGAGGAAMQMASGGGGSGVLGMGSNIASIFGAGGVGGSLMAGAGWLTGATTLGGSLTAGASLLGTGTLAGGAAGLGMIAGAIAPIALAAAALGNVLGLFRKTEKRGYGLMGTLGEEDGVHSLDLMRKGGSLVSGPKWFVRDTGVSDMDKALQETYKQQRDALIDMGKALGLATDGVENFTVQLGSDELGDKKVRGIRLDGLSDEEAQKKIAEALATANNEIAQQIIGTWERTVREVERIDISRPTDVGDTTDYGVPNVIRESIVDERYIPSEFARDGEQAIDTLTRLATSITGVNAIFDTLGLSVYEASLSAADAASSFVDLFGGLENLNAAAQTYYQNFYSEDERRAKAREGMDKVFDDLGIERIDYDDPEARKKYREIVEREQARMVQEQQNREALRANFTGLILPEGGMPDSGSIGDIVRDFLGDTVGEMTDGAMDQLNGLISDFDTGALSLEGFTGSVMELIGASDDAGLSAEETVAALLNASGAFAAVTQSSDDAAESARRLAEEEERKAEEARRKAEEAVDLAFRNLQAATDRQLKSIDKQREALSAQRDSYAESLSLITGIFDIVRSNARELYGEVADTASMQAAQGMLFIEDALAAARATGALPESDALSQAIQAARRGITDGAYVSQFERDRDTLVLAGQLSALEEISGKQKTFEEQQIERLDEQLKGLDKQSKQLQEQLDYWREQIDISRGAYDATLSVEQALRGIEALIKPKDPAAKPTAPGGTSGSGGSTGGPVFGGGARPAEPEAARYRRMVYGGTAGVGYSAIRDESLIARLDKLAPVYHAFDGTGDLVGLAEAFKAAGGTIADLSILSGNWESDWRKAFASVGIPAFAVGTNYVPRDMLAHIHEGEAIVPKAFNPWAGGQGMQGGNAELIAEVRALREEVAQLKSINAATASNTAGLPQMVEQFDNVTEGGNAIRSEVMA